MKRREGVRPMAALFALLVAGSALAAGAAPADILTLPQAITLGLQQNPALAAAKAQADAAGHEVPQAGALADPRLSIGVANLPMRSFALDEEPMTMIQFGISQPLPYPGKRALMTEKAEQRAAAAALGSGEAALWLVREIRQGWWQLFQLDRALETVAGNHTLLEKLEETARSLYSVGQGRQQEVLLAQLEIASLRDQALLLQQQRDEAQIRLNTLLNRPPATPITLPPVPAAPAPLPELAAAAELRSGALAHRPELHATQALLEAARAQRELSARDRYPDFAVDAMYGYRDGFDDMVSLQLSMNLPLYAGRKQSRAEDQRQAELIAARERLRETETRIAAEVAMAEIRYRRSRQQVALFEQTILPQARQSAESLLAGYQTGKVMFADLIRARTALHDYENRYWQAYSEAQQALAALDAATAKEIPHE